MKQNLILVTNSPLAKIFLKRYRVMTPTGAIETVRPEDLIDEPERIWKEEAFCVPFPTVRGNIEFWSGTPAIIEDQTRRDVLIGGRNGYDSTESDWTGLVLLDIETDVLTGIFQIASGGKAPSVEKQVKAALKESKEKSNYRCLQAARRVFARMQMQRKSLQEDGKGRSSYILSPTEQLCAIVLEREATAEIERKRRQEKSIDAILDRIENLGANHAPNAAI